MLKRAFFTMLFLVGSKLSFAQSLTYYDLVNVLRNSTSYAYNLLTSKGFKITETKKLGDAQLYCYRKNVEVPLNTETIYLGSYLTSKKDTIKHFTITYFNYNLAYMEDFARATNAVNYVLNNKIESENDVLYDYESDDLIMDVSMTKKINNPYSIMFVDKKSKLLN